MVDFISALDQSPLIATIVAISIVIYFYVNRNLNYWKKRGISGPKPIALFGNMHSYFIKSQPEVEVEWCRKYGKIFGLFIGNSPVIAVAEPELMKQILVKEFHKIPNRREVATRHPIISKNMVFAVDDDWKRLRSIVTPTFSGAKLKKLYSLMKKCSDELMDCLNAHAVNGKQIDLKSVMGAYTLDVIAKCAYSTNANIYNDPRNGFTENVMKIYNVSQWKVFVYFLLPTFVAKSHCVRKIFVNSKGGEFFIDVARHLITERKRSNNGIVKHEDFLQLLIEAEKSENYETDHMAANHLNEGKDEIEANVKVLNESHIKSADKKLTENELLAQCQAFIMAGYESTASTLTYCSYELALHPEIQHILYEEIELTFDSNGNIDYDTLLKLPYLDAVISETLRIYPPALRLERKATEDIVLGDTGITIPKGMIVEVPIYGIHHDPQNYPNPNQFIPERFMPANRSHIKPYTYLPFGTGPRNCIGMRFSLLEAKLALANIVKRFTFSATSRTSNPLQYKSGRFLLQTVRPIIVAINRR